MAYNRVGLTQYFSHRSVEQQLMKPRAWYEENNVNVALGDPVEEIDTAHKRVRARQTGWVHYDICVLATGSSAALPPGVSLDAMRGVFVYRTLQDLNDIIAWSERENVQHASIVGGGLLGLEAAKAAKDLGLQVTVYERSDRLMSRQLDQDASRMLEAEIQKLSLEAVVGDCPVKLKANDQDEICGLDLSSGQYKETQMVIYAIGIRPRDNIIQSQDHLLIERAAHGGFKVNEYLETSVPDVYAIGECASFKGIIYGLVAPGYE